MPQPKAPQTPFNELEEEWYGRLKDSGFTDIEQTSDPDRPLKDWHSFRFVSIEAQVRMEARSAYQIQIDSFANDPSFSEVTVHMVGHGNSKFSNEGVERIWDLHRQGFSERGIAREMGCSRSCITFLLRRMREWMNLIA